MSAQMYYCDRKIHIHRLTIVGILMLCCTMLGGPGCLPAPPADNASYNITIYGFSIMKEPLEKEIFPAFAERWLKQTGHTVRFTSSFAGSETVTNQILQGVSVDVALLSIERDAQRLKEGGAVTSDWHGLPHAGIVNSTPFVILVRKGNPKGIHDFADLARPGVAVIHPDPASSGGAQWSLLAIYGSELVKSTKRSASLDHVRAQQLLQGIWHNVIAMPGSAREARTQFETGYGDALITYELEALTMKQAGLPVEMIVPEATIFSEHPVVIIDRGLPTWKRPIVEAFVQYLWSEDAQRAFVKYNFRSVTDEKLNQARTDFSQIQMPFTVELFGGWDKAYAEVIDGVWRQKIQKNK